MSKQRNNTRIDFENILLLIEEARNRAFSKVNAELVMLYYHVGSIVALKVKEGVWGEGTIDQLAEYIQIKQPGLRGFNRRGLYRMKQFYETYSDPQFLLAVPDSLKCVVASNTSIVTTMLSQLEKNSEPNQFVTTVLTQIQWSAHLHILNKTKSPEEKIFYLLHAIKERLSVRELERQLNAAVYERTMLSDKSVSSVLTQIPQGVFKDPYIFEFLDLPDVHSEKDFEQALIKNLQKFILEIGKGFAYMGNQFRLQVGNKDYYTDLLFYHRDLQCLVLFELKIEEFKPEFLGKLNFYLEALDRDVKRPHENHSIGVLLCKGKDTEVVEYAMSRNLSKAMIADYETKLIDKTSLARKLHQLAEQLTKEID